MLLGDGVLPRRDDLHGQRLHLRRRDRDLRVGLAGRVEAEGGARAGRGAGGVGEGEGEALALGDAAATVLKDVVRKRGLKQNKRGGKKTKKQQQRNVKSSKIWNL